MLLAELRMAVDPGASPPQTTFTTHYCILTTDQSALLACKARVVDYRSILTNNWSISYPILNNFLGNLPNELGQLRRLIFISFTFNKLSGSIATWIGVLSKLQALHATYNVIDGNIPSAIGNFSNLLYLNLAYNNLQVYKPIRKMVDWIWIRAINPLGWFGPPDLIELD
ncbi:hypothetical protein CUMW_134730 [Citrus unshiu]|nr:hypothetical protein CUMW_134730 [Citrus unshiu]